MANISAFRRDNKIAVHEQVIQSSYGPDALLRMKTTASTFSDSGFQIEIKSLSSNALLSAESLLVCVPITVRFKDQAGRIIQPNQQHAWNSARAAGKLRNANDMSLRQQGLLQSLESLIVSVNGTALQCRPKMWLSAVQKLFCEGRYDSKEGYAFPCAPYTNSASNPLYKEKGREELVRDFVSESNIAAVTFQANEISDIAYSFLLTMQLPVGMFQFVAFPGLEQFTGCKTSAIPYCENITIEAQFKSKGVLDDWFCMADNYEGNSLSCPEMTTAYTTAGDATDQLRIVVASKPKADRADQPSSEYMWARRSYGQKAAMLAQVGTCLDIGEPYAQYIYVAPSLAMQITKPLFVLPSISWTTYEKSVQIGATAGDVGKVDFSHLKIDALSPLYVVFVEAADYSIGDYIGAAQSINNADPAQMDRLGMAKSNVWAPIKWETVRINLSTKNSCLHNLTSEEVTSYDMYYLYKKYTKQRLSYAQWRATNMCLIFSPQDIGIGFAHQYSALTLSISFDCEKLVQLTGPKKSSNNARSDSGYVVRTSSYDRAQGKSCHLTARLLMMEQQAIGVSENACAVETIKYSAQDLRQAFFGGGAQETIDEDAIDQYAQ